MDPKNYTLEELYASAQENAVAFALVGLANAKAQGTSIDSVINTAGERLAPTWQATKKDDPQNFLHNIALNITALGGKLDSINDNPSQAEATFVDWIRPSQAQAFGLTLEEADQWWNVFQPLAQAAHLNYHWNRSSDRINVTVSK